MLLEAHLHFDLADKTLTTIRMESPATDAHLDVASSESLTMELEAQTDGEDAVVDVEFISNVMNGGTFDHSRLNNRYEENQHSIGAITGLSMALGRIEAGQLDIWTEFSEVYERIHMEAVRISDLTDKMNASDAQFRQEILRLDLMDKQILSTLYSEIARLDTRITGLVMKEDDAALIYNNYKNFKVFTLTEGSDPLQIIKIPYLSTLDTQAEFNANIIFESQAGAITAVPRMNGDIVTGYDIVEPTSTIKFTFKIDGAALDLVRPEQKVRGGKHIVQLFFPMDQIIPGPVHTLEVMAEVVGAPVVIPKFHIAASVIGQWMVSTSGIWDGTFTLEETFGALSFNTRPFTMAPITQSVFTEQRVDIKSVITTQFGALTLQTAPLSMAAVTETLTPYIPILTARVAVGYGATYSSTYVSTTSNIFAIQKAYVTPSLEQPIDTGLMCSISVNTSAFTRVDGIEVTQL